MHYLDTSVCVAALTPEPASDAVEAWLTGHREAPLAISGWVHAELASALSIKVRTHALGADERAETMAAWQSVRQGLRTLVITDEAYTAAADMVARHELGLRAGDALHLAVAAAYGCTIVTLDARMAGAAPKLGVPLATI